MSAPPITFPNYTQIPSRIPVKVWHGLRAGSIVGALTLAALLIADPDTGLFVMWKVVIPLLPLLFLTAPGLWRNLCPLAASNQTPRALKLTKAQDRPELAQGIRLRHRVQPVHRRSWSCASSASTTAARYSALLLLGAMAAAFTGGLFLKGKSGWCSTICPLLPVQRIYGQTPLFLVANAHCQPCVGCVKNCYDFNPRAAYLADLHDQDTYWSGYRKYFVGAFPGLVLGFFAVPVEQMALTDAVSLAVFATLTTFFKTSAHTITSLFGATAFAIFYWYAADVGIDPLTYALRAAAIALAATWFVRTLKTGAAVPGQGDTEAAGPRPAGRRRPRGRAHRGPQRRPAGHLPPRQQARRPQAGPDAARDRSRPTACRSRPAAGWASAAPTRSRSRTA